MDTPKSNPTLNAIFDAYLAEKNNRLSYRPCKHPGTLKVCLLVPRKLWGDMAIEDFGTVSV